MNNIVIADIIFTTASIVGLLKILPSIRKVLLVDYSDAISLIHNETHVILLSLVICGYFIAGAKFGFIVGLIELLSRLYFIKLIRKKRSHKLTYPSDIIYYIIKFLKKGRIEYED
jgi:hypothetical protein